MGRLTFFSTLAATEALSLMVLLTRSSPRLDVISTLEIAFEPVFLMVKMPVLVSP